MSAWAAARLRDRPVLLRGSFSRGAKPGWMIAATVCLTLVGGVVVWNSWPAADDGDERQAAAPAAASAQPEASGEEATENRGPSSESTPTTDEVADILDGLSADRARALSRGDAAALRELTVPGSAAAAADELLDHSLFAGGAYAIEVDSVKVLSASADRIVASARMRSHAGSGDTSEDFGALVVEFELKRFGDGWRVQQVTEIGDGVRPSTPQSHS